MKVVIQAGKLQKILNNAKEVVSSKNDVTAPLESHILIQFIYNNGQLTNVINFLAGDKELNHYFSATLEESLNEYCVTSTDQEHFFSINCNRLADSIIGIPKDYLITIDATDVFNTSSLFSHCKVEYANTNVRIEASRGEGYPLFDIDRKSNESVIDLTVDNKILSNLIESTAFSIDPKRAGGTQSSLNNLVFYISPKSLKMIGAESSRVSIASYKLNPELDSLFINPDSQAKFYFPLTTNPINGLQFTPNVAGKHEYDFNQSDDLKTQLIEDGVFHFSDEIPLVATMSKKAALELRKFANQSADKIHLKVTTNSSRRIKTISLNSDTETLIFSLTYVAPPNFTQLLNRIPKQLPHHVIVKAHQVREVIKRALRFDDLITLNILPQYHVLEISATNTTSAEDFNTSIWVPTINASFRTRITGKHIDEILACIDDSKNITMNLIATKFIVFKEQPEDVIDRLFIISIIGQASAQPVESSDVTNSVATQANSYTSSTPVPPTQYNSEEDEDDDYSNFDDE